MVHCDLSEDEIVRRKQLSDHTRKMICGILNVVAEDDTSIMTTYRDFYLQISFSVLHPLMVFCLAKPLEGSMATLNKRSNEMNLRSVLGSHFVNEDFGCYNYRATHWLDTEMDQRRFFEILDRCCDEAVRYADDFRIFCRTKKDAECVMIAVTNWLAERLKLEVSPEKTRIVNVKRKYSEFLGFKIKVHRKSHKYVVASYMSDKAFQRQSQKLLEQAKNIAHPRKGRNEHSETMLYNSMVIGLHEYYRVATNINLDCERIDRSVMTVLTNRLRKQQSCRLVRKGRPLTKFEVKKFGNTRMMRYVAKTKEPIYPVGYIQCKNPMARKRTVNPYTPEGRKGLHDNLRINTVLMGKLMMQNSGNHSIAYTDNRISLFSAQWGKCAVTGHEFYCVEDIHCHHKLPKHMGGTDAYANLVLILEPVHRLIHAISEATIQKYLNLLNLSDKQLAKLNQLREQAGCKAL